MTKSAKNHEAPDPAVPATVTHAPATRLESGEILSSAEDHELYAAAAQADGAGDELEEGLIDG